MCVCDYIVGGLGGNTRMTIYGKGLGHNSTMSLTICGKPCTEFSGTSSKMYCIVPASGMYTYSHKHTHTHTHI